MQWFISIARHAIQITVFVFLMMLAIDYFNVLTGGKAKNVVKGGLWRQYITTSFLGSTPGCLGAFLNVSFYIHGLISFGALTGSMIATSGDEAFVMLATFPRDALILMGLLFLLGVGSGWISDKLFRLLKIKPCIECPLHEVHENDKCRCIDAQTLKQNLYKPSLLRIICFTTTILVFVCLLYGILGPLGWNLMRVVLLILSVIAATIIVTVPEHYLHEHIWSHIIKRHLWKIFLWTFSALLFIDVGFKYWDLELFITNHIEWVGVIAVLLALVPESGPHMIFVLLYAKGLIPFSVLLASSIVQDGHGLLPLLSYSVRDTILVKLFNLGFGVLIGGGFYLFGL